MSVVWNKIPWSLFRSKQLVNMLSDGKGLSTRWVPPFATDGIREDLGNDGAFQGTDFLSREEKEWGLTVEERLTRI